MFVRFSEKRLDGDMWRNREGVWPLVVFAAATTT